MNEPVVLKGIYINKNSPGDQNIKEDQWQNNLPANFHKLIITETGQ